MCKRRRTPESNSPLCGHRWRLHCIRIYNNSVNKKKCLIAATINASFAFNIAIFYYFSNQFFISHHSSCISLELIAFFPFSTPKMLAFHLIQYSFGRLKLKCWIEVAQFQQLDSRFTCIASVLIYSHHARCFDGWLCVCVFGWGFFFLFLQSHVTSQLLFTRCRFQCNNSRTVCCRLFLCMKFDMWGR